jgi:peptidoglycan/LPS O-acetylase OafA/YrhL
VGATQTSTPPPSERSPGVETAVQTPSPGLQPPPGNPRFPLFDGLRALAATGVLLFHAAEFGGHLGFGVGGRFAEVAGGESVILFFAISGFLLYRPYVLARARARGAPATAVYARRRALRILPAYWVALTLLAIFPGIFGAFSGNWWRYYGYSQIYTERTLGGGIASAWTLGVEVTFYIALPIWAFAARRLPGRHWLRNELLALGLIGGFGGLVQLAASRQHVSSLIAVSLAGEILWLAIGMAFAVVSVAAQQGDPVIERLGGVIRRHGSACWAAAVLVYAALMVLVPRGGLFGLIAIGGAPQPLLKTAGKLALQAVLVSLLVAPAVFASEERRGVPARLLSWRPVVWICVISYSFYLYHFTIVELIATPGRRGSFSAPGLNLVGHLHTMPSSVLFVLSFVATAAVGAVSYRFVELPFLRLKERR